MSALGLIGSADLAINTDTLLTPSGGITEPGIVVVNLCNRNSAQVAVRIAIGTGATPAATDYIEYDTPLGANQPLERTQLSLSQGEKIWVRSDTASVSACARGVPST